MLEALRVVSKGLFYHKPPALAVGLLTLAAEFLDSVDDFLKSVGIFSISFHELCANQLLDQGNHLFHKRKMFSGIRVGLYGPFLFVERAAKTHLFRCVLVPEPCKQPFGYASPSNADQEENETGPCHDGCDDNSYFENERNQSDQQSENNRSNTCFNQVFSPESKNSSFFGYIIRYGKYIVFLFHCKTRQGNP